MRISFNPQQQVNLQYVLRISESFFLQERQLQKERQRFIAVSSTTLFISVSSCEGYTIIFAVIAAHLLRGLRVLSIIHAILS